MGAKWVVVLSIFSILAFNFLLAAFFVRIFKTNDSKKDTRKLEEEKMINTLREDLNLGVRKLYLASTRVGGTEIYSILPLKPGEMNEFGELNSWVEISLEIAFGLLQEEDLLVNQKFVKQILQEKVIQIEKYEPAINK